MNLLEQRINQLREDYKLADQKTRAEILWKVKMIKRAMKWNMPVKNFSYCNGASKLSAWLNTEKNVQDTLLTTS